ncbi:MAG: PAS domain-containing protein, partial [Chloroflexi bacterium]|nr:PAS domain-containing protein [Chloroflexota bacterium]
GSGRVTLMNPMAEALTGWSRAEAAGEPLGKIFPLLSEETRQPVEDPVDRVLREGLVIGLGNHTLLITRDGREIPIADSAAPIRDETGLLSGVVLVFRDQTAERRHLRRLNALNALGQALAKSGDLSSIFRAAYEHLPQIVDCPCFLISLYDDETRTLRAAYALSDGEPLDISSFPPLLIAE